MIIVGVFIVRNNALPRTTKKVVKPIIEGYSGKKAFEDLV